MSEYIYATDEHEGHWLTGEEIVRCMDCAYAFDYGSRCRKWRGQDCFENSVPEHVKPDGFCAWARRRDA